MIYGASNVCTYKIEKESNFLCFKFVGFSKESEHLEKGGEMAWKLLIREVK
jgi:hypothetical protein